MANINFKDTSPIEGENPDLASEVTSENKLKEFLVEYVGEQRNPESGEVTVQMIVETIADEFPEFLMVVAEENWVRGYHQALVDVEEGQKAMEQKGENNEPQE